jgi:tRNA 2-selenouridine synthase
MRSGAMAWSLDLYGVEVYVIEGGYKSYRNRAISLLAEEYKPLILGGMTGSGKTKILHQLRLLGEQVIDLEELAQHQGSSYGSMNKMIQPTQEQFENNLSEQLRLLDRNKRIWIEDESSSIGKRVIPRPFWNQMVSSPLVDLQVPAERRIETLTQEYGPLDKDFLIESTMRIGKRLGPAQTKDAITAIKEDRMADFIRLAIVYYDKTYRTGLTKRKQDEIYPVAISDTNHAFAAKQIMDVVKAHKEL